MNGAIAWFAKNRVAANLLMVGILIAGALSFFIMEREIEPQINVNLAQVDFTWPGAGPRDVEEQVLVRLEEAVSDLENIEWVMGFANEGGGRFLVRAGPTVDMAPFMNDVKLRLDAITSLPGAMEPLRVSQMIQRRESIRLALHGNLPERDLKRLAEDLRRQVSQLPGASIVELFGVRNEEVSIELSEAALRRYGLTFDEVAAAVRSSSLNLSGGSVRTDAGELTLSARNLADTQQEFESIILRQTPEGALIRIGDVATVIDGFEDEDILATLNGEPAVLIQVMTTDHMNVVTTSEAVQKWMDEVARPNLPEGTALSLWWDSAKLYEDRMATIGSSAFYGLILVFIVLILSLRPIVAFWVTVGIATAYAGAFVLLPGNDISINMLSTFAFLLVLGIVVDDAIVVGESIHEQGHNEEGGLESATLGAQLVAKPVVYAVLTTMIAFLPWLFMTGEIVQITRHITVVIICALSFSLIEALLILPAHLSKMKPRTNLGWFGQRQKRIADAITNFAQTHFRRLVSAALINRYVVAAAFFGFFVISVGVVSSGWLKVGFEPEIEDEQIVVDVAMPEGTPYARSLEVLDQLQIAQRALEDEANSASEAGRNKLIDSWYTRSRRDSVFAVVKLAPAEERSWSAKEAAERLYDLIGEVPDAEQVTVNFTTGDDDPAIEFAVRHRDIEVMRAAVDDLKDKLRTYSEVYSVRDNLRRGVDEMNLVLRPGAEKYGVTLAELSRQIRQAYYGEEVQRLPRDGNDVKVMARLAKDERTSLASLADFRVRVEGGLEIPLTAVADVEFAPGMKQIIRRDRQRAGVVSAEIRDGVRQEVIDDLKENYFPEWKKRFPGVTDRAIGHAEGEAQFWAEVGSLYAVALFAMYALIAVAFRSYWLPLLIMTAIPFGYMGAVYGHLAFDATLGIFSYFGIAAAVGVVVNDNLVLIHHVQRLRDRGMGAFEAMAQGAVDRFRPIVLTSVTTFVGLVPMMLERSLQAQFLKPTVIALAFGVLFATFVTLLLVPALYTIGDDLRRGAERSSSWLKQTYGRPGIKDQSPAE